LLLPSGLPTNGFDAAINFFVLVFFASTLLVVGDCLRCLASGTNTNNGGQWAPDGEEHQQRREADDPMHADR